MIDLFKEKKKILVLTLTALCLLLLTGFLFSQFVKHQNFVRASPYDVLISDIQANIVTVSWKTEVETPTYIKVIDNETLLGDGENSKSHRVKITGLNESSEYRFVISDGEREWQKTFVNNSDNLSTFITNDFVFTTKDIKEEIMLPNAEELKVLPNELLYIALYNKEKNEYSEIKSYYANRFGGVVVDLTAFDTTWDKSEYEIYNLEYFSSKNIKVSRNTVFASEINCNQNVSAQTISGLSKAEYTDLATRWVAGRGKNYASECFNDTVYRSKMAGVDPAFTLALWLNESGASNYTQNMSLYGYIEDFGIHGLASVPPQDFNAQINHFLKRNHVNSCPGLTAWEAWGNIYKWGRCNEDNPVNRQDGIDYYKQIEMVYGWITNGKKLPAKVTGLAIPVDIGDDGGDWGDISNSICCALKLDNQESFQGDFENEIGTKKCEDIWAVGRSVYGGKIQYSVEIKDKKEGACEVKYEGVCCKLDHDIKWYPKVACPSIVQGITSSSSCKEYSSDRSCFFRDGKYEWLPKSVGEDNVKGVLTEAQCAARNTITTYELKLERGINFIGFDFAPTLNTNVLYASKLILQNKDILLIGNFQGYEWKDLVKQSSTLPFAGQDFFFEQNRGYLIITTKDTVLKLDGWRVSNLEYSELKDGWNLVGGVTYTKSKKASTLISDLSNKKIDIDIVGVWSYDLGTLIYRREQADGEVYGEDITLGNNQGVFIKK